ncbi:hypothetical protein [Staphylococcus edaphicus]|uniref:Uncharacterized protein n=1 Tax=Staphylococcus edaphicus TaxID=1955013 RepID=A0A2C6WS73_9STAP|nr:hypothetical protein [Staphylococcus edaphicus]PHK50317.1 hypothetical protein BTJ66_04390 [Staphylococcus edaphicus]UQW82089.1 hypothetical protein MNY58_03005 [Staphylococcus edaphicus]
MNKTTSIHTAVESQLYDLFDDTKYELSELNKNKQLVLNGPDNKLIKRGLDISYLQGQKKAIDAIDMILKNYSDDTSFKLNFTEYSANIIREFELSATKFKNLEQPTEDYDAVLAHHYTLMGQKLIIDTIHSTILNHSF